MSDWIYVCPADEIDEDDLVRFDHAGQTYCVYNTEKGFFATAGLCTHEATHLEYGLVMGTEIECPLHQGRFDVCTGQALSAPVSEDLSTYPVKVSDGDVFIQLD